MTKPKHTPGPWRLSKATRFSITDRWRVEAFRTLDVVLTPCPDGYAPGENEANARLIAAAPCLLARLESMAAQHACGCGHPACKRCADDRANQEVIERAKGGAE